MVPITSGTSGFLSSLNPLSSAGKKFNAMAVKRVYFGNWLRDYSQAVDVGTLSKGLDPKTIRLLVWVMGFMAFGYATEEFEVCNKHEFYKEITDSQVTNARLGVYRPEEHIDNPKGLYSMQHVFSFSSRVGYPNPEEHDARKFDSRL
ncbi:HET-C domain protein HetC [Taphrina deformans PYCC 5710]|uniref:HET-C domain protein HetC n=1 Tax=Taphrina deformans (strain PYCC 5710 / ATCC 11124 / CBS 356.35 / IMI 108563 / JCM 9778 / NBRC 8474) TaxID=1097556 RepID=R4X813_TAPDE|nr:HET-C domain protein HetC [Taphrina deformans PYCC 5710]|eukprot:CCG81634.1 HET-C domain protein HetC [Taphrina deformans PYCC 5710]